MSKDKNESTLTKADRLLNRMTADVARLERIAEEQKRLTPQLSLTTIKGDAGKRLAKHLKGASGAVKFRERREHGKIVVDVYLAN